MTNHQNLLRSAHALATVGEPPVEITYDYELLCKNLGTCRTDGGSLVLNADAFTANISNITPKRINDSLLRIGVEIDWDVFGRNASLQISFGETGVRNAATAMEQWLKRFILTRNRIAHCAIGGTQISEAELRMSMEILAAFAPTLAQAIEDVLKKKPR